VRFIDRPCGDFRVSDLTYADRFGRQNLTGYERFASKTLKMENVANLVGICSRWLNGTMSARSPVGSSSMMQPQNSQIVQIV
jgi:hypothetical protein